MSNSRQKQLKPRRSIALTSPGGQWPRLFSFLVSVASASAQFSAGPAYSKFALTLEAGERTEVISPLFYSEHYEDITRWAFPPLMSMTHDSGIDSTEFDILYPLLSYDRFGAEYRFHIGQLFNFSGGQMQNETNKDRFALFPIYLQQRSPDSAQNYTSVLPFYGDLKNRFFRDEVHYIMMPLYVRSRKRDVVTENYLYPVFHLRHGDGLHGWQFWPLVGLEEKVPTARTNMWDETELVPGHQKQFVLWPLFLNARSGIGSTNSEHTQAILPFYNLMRSPMRDATTVPWMIGVSITDDRAKGYHEIGAPWPFIVFRRGDTANTSRVFPFYSHATNEFVESTWYLWPVYKYNRVHAEALDRDRTRIFLYLYSDMIERNLEAGTRLRRRDFWPFFTHRKDREGNERLQILAVLEPILPNNKSIERNYSPLWSLWRQEKNARSGARSQSLLWNLYRHESDPKSSSSSALFGLVQRSTTSNGSHWRLFYLPWKKASESSAQASPR